mgnify:CR=1 FL=1
MGRHGPAFPAPNRLSADPCERGERGERFACRQEILNRATKRGVWSHGQDGNMMQMAVSRGVFGAKHAIGERVLLLYDFKKFIFSLLNNLFNATFVEYFIAQIIELARRF